MSTTREDVKKWAWEHLEENFTFYMSEQKAMIPIRTVDQLLDLTITGFIEKMREMAK